MGLFSKKERTPLEQLYAKANKDQRKSGFILWNTIYAELIMALNKGADTLSIKVTNAEAVQTALKEKKPVPSLDLNLAIPIQPERPEVAKDNNLKKRISSSRHKTRKKK